MLTLARIKQLIAGLEFNRDDVAYKAHDEKIQKRIKEAEAELETEVALEKKPHDLNESDEAEYKKQLGLLCYQLALVAAFKDRDPKKSLKYLNDYLQSGLAADSLELAEAYNLIGYAHTMDPSYIAVDHLEKAKAILDKLHFDDVVNQRRKQYEEAFNERYFGLSSHRLSRTKPSLFIEAQEKFQSSANTFKLLAGDKPCAQLAESLHLFGASLLAQGNYELKTSPNEANKAQKTYNDAIQKLTEAYELELGYEKATGKSHFMVFTTLQTLSDGQRLLAATSDPETAKQLRSGAKLNLLAAKEGQKKHFGDISNNPDYAKSCEFLGLVYLDSEMYTEATEEFIASLTVKIEAYGNKEHPTVGWTHGSIISLLQKLDALLPVEGTPKFGVVNQIETCIALLKTQIEKLSDKCNTQLDQLSNKLQTCKAQMSPKASALRAISTPASAPVSQPNDTVSSVLTMRNQG